MAMWSFWIDRGGTFTDVVAVRPDGSVATHKLLSTNERRYSDASIAGMKELLSIGYSDPFPPATIASVTIGTTVATNALLEHKGEPTLLLTTKGFKDALKIGYQNRPKIFDLEIKLPKQIYSEVIEADERVDAKGNVLQPLHSGDVREKLFDAYKRGFRSIAVVFMHGYAYPHHENIVGKIAREIGFPQISLSHRTIPLMKLVSRGDTTVVDAYLSPLLVKYIDSLKRELGDTPLFFMQSNGGLVSEKSFKGKESILSGPAGGVVGMIKTATTIGAKKIIGFDMGGTSTDVSHYSGELERLYETEIAGIKLRAPLLNIHTIAAGGGSILHFKNGRYVVGPDSAGASPGPACYRNGGPLTLTDCNLLLGKIEPRYFPHIFGESGELPLDKEAAVERFLSLQRDIEEATGKKVSIESIAEGFLQVAVENMANAIKKISIEKGHKVSDYLLNGFGGAAGQHVCKVADTLGIEKILLHPHAGVLSAVGIGLADFRTIEQCNVEKPLSNELLDTLETTIKELIERCRIHIEEQKIPKQEIETVVKAHIRYAGTDSDLPIAYGSVAEMEENFRGDYETLFGFVDRERELIVTSLSVEGIVRQEACDLAQRNKGRSEKNAEMTKFFTGGRWVEAPLYHREAMPLVNEEQNRAIEGPALIIEANATTVIEPGWRGHFEENGSLILTRSTELADRKRVAKERDPVMLEVFNNRFMNIAEQMGVVLKNTSSSVNIRERLDFSCALFDGGGALVANAPHIPVHLGSMSESVKSIRKTFEGDINPGDVFITNDPFNGGTHLPDITVVTPIFDEEEKKLLFFTASRGHHADIGGITPGSMPANSRTIEEEGAYIRNSRIVRGGAFDIDLLKKRFLEIPYPARNFRQNIEDIKAQIAANNSGMKNLKKLCQEFGSDVVIAYMSHVRENAKASVVDAIKMLKSNSFTYTLDDESRIVLDIAIDNERGSATFDFSGSSDQSKRNYNAPKAVTIACIIYMLRCLIKEEIPLNAGCLEPITLLIPEKSMLNPHYPAPVCAGNVETSQAIVDTIIGALGTIAASQGTTNSFTFGNDKYQYYETICGGAGAGESFDGASAVHTHITNTRLTDPEILEWRFPVLLEEFSIRKGSGGTGKQCGGDGVYRKIRFLEAMSASILSSHRKYPPFGAHGGEPGKIGSNSVIRNDGTTEDIGGCSTVSLEKNESIVIMTPGGGGYGRAQ